jgi:hypothetical protein
MYSLYFSIMLNIIDIMGEIYVILPGIEYGYKQKVLFYCFIQQIREMELLD